MTLLIIAEFFQTVLALVNQNTMKKTLFNSHVMHAIIVVLLVMVIHLQIVWHVHLMISEPFNLHLVNVIRDIMMVRQMFA